MRIIALETSTRQASLALLDDARVVATWALDPGQRAGTHLTPLLKATLEEMAWPLSTIELIVVNRGPGSFTGLRVGVTTAKVLTYVVGAQLVAVDALEVIALQAPVTRSWVAAVVDAHRRQLFRADFYFGPRGELQQRTDTRLVDIDSWTSSLPPRAVVTGPGLEIANLALPGALRVTSPDCWLPRAGTVGQLGWRMFNAGQRSDVWALVPSYHRRSAAEEKWIP